MVKGISFKNNSLCRNINPKNLSKELIEDLKIVDKYLSDEDDDIGLALGNNNNTAYADETRKTNVRTHNYSDTEEDGGSRFSIDMTLCDPWELKIVQKCWVRVKTFHLQDHVRKLQENSVDIVNLSSKLKFSLKIPKEAATINDLYGRVNVIEDAVNESLGGERDFSPKVVPSNLAISVSQLAKEIVSDLENSKSQPVVEIVKFSCEDKREPVSVEANKNSRKESPGLQSLSVSSTSMLGGIVDSDSDDDVIIIEESFVDPGFEFQSLSKSSNNIQDIRKEFPQVKINQEDVNTPVKKAVSNSGSPKLSLEKAIPVDKKEALSSTHIQSNNIMKTEVKKHVDTESVHKVCRISKDRKQTRNDKKVRKVSRHNKLCAVQPPTMSSLTFKIPKTKSVKPAIKALRGSCSISRSLDVVHSDGKSITIKSFLEQENIVQDASLDRFVENNTRQEFDS